MGTTEAQADAHTRTHTACYQTTATKKLHYSERERQQMCTRAISVSLKMNICGWRNGDNSHAVL